MDDVNVRKNESNEVETICRLCAKESDNVVGIYSDEGRKNDLATKITTYLPIRVTELDELPLQCCSNCTSIVLNWHEMVVGCVEAEKLLNSVKVE